MYHLYSNAVGKVETQAHDFALFQHNIPHTDPLL